MKLNDFDKIKYNGVEVDKVKYNGVLVWEKSTIISYLTFESEDNLEFTLSNANTTANWEGTIEYSTDTKTWSTWTGNEISSNNGKLYLRGLNNTQISGARYRNFVFGGASSAIQCIGNIEMLLDYNKVLNGEHPTMSNWCCQFLFYNCTVLTTPPTLPTIEISTYCYNGMFYGCTSLRVFPLLPAIIMQEQCYSHMFRDCTNIKLSATQTSEYPYEWRIPISGTGTGASGWNYYMLNNTGGTFTDSPSINTIYYTNNQPI